jgi:BirA family biotin operon repressor/biotin-[acetyl-CoA-carboxylase] ligase
VYFYIHKGSFIAKSGRIADMDDFALHHLLKNIPLADIRYRESMESTNDEALTWFEQGVPDASLVITNNQTRGRGRMKRQWYSSPEAALTFSLILRPKEIKKASIAFYAPLAGLVVCKALEQCAGLSPQIKWPNDVLLQGKKTAGILTEAVWDGDFCRGVIVGIGVNIAPVSMPESDIFPLPAISINEVAGKKIDRWQLLYWILDIFFQEQSKLGSKSFFEQWEKRLAYQGERVTIIPISGTSFTGKMLGINQNGDLRVELDDGATKEIAAGDVHLRYDSGS